MKHYRLLGILLMLENYGLLTAKALSDHFEVSVRTIYRDLDCLSEAGYAIITESGKGGGITLGHNKRLRVNAMEADELVRLIDKLSFGQPQDAIDEQLALKVRGQLPAESQLIFDRLVSRSLVDNRSWMGIEKHDQATKVLIQRAIAHTKKLRFDYINNQGIATGRLVWPQGLVDKAGALYLVAYCELRREMRTFKLAQIRNLEVTEVTYALHETFDLRTYWEASVQAMTRPRGASDSAAGKPFDPKGGSPPNWRYPVRLLVQLEPHLTCYEGDVVQALSKRFDGFSWHVEPPSSSQLKKHCRILNCDLISENLAIAHLLRYGDHIGVIEPETLKKCLIERLNRLLDFQRSSHSLT